MELNEFIVEGKPHHYTKLAVAISESLNPEHHLCYYVKGKYKYTIINGRILTIVEGNGNSQPHKQKL